MRTPRERLGGGIEKSRPNPRAAQPRAVPQRSLIRPRVTPYRPKGDKHGNRTERSSREGVLAAHRVESGVLETPSRRVAAQRRRGTRAQRPPRPRTVLADRALIPLSFGPLAFSPLAFGKESATLRVGLTIQRR